MNFSFLHPALLYGLVLAAVPIIIHLLFRRRFLEVDWAPMQYLKLSLKRNRRRIRLEQLILLALRVGAIVLLFFLVARPVMQPRGLGAWLSGRSRTSQILVLDNSLSMGYVDDGRSAFQRARELAVELLRSIGPQDRFTLALSTDPDRAVLREVEAVDRDAIQQAIEKLSLSDAYTSWDAALAAVHKLIQSSIYPIREVALVTDLRRAGWDPRVAEIGNRWAAGRVRLRIFDVANDSSENDALVELEQLDRVALVGTPSRWQAVVQSGRRTDLGGIDATLTVDGKPGLVRLPAIPASTLARIPLSVTFQDSGTHHISFSLPRDELEGDNQRWAVTRVKDQLRMVLVDGEPSSEPLGGEVDFLSLALSLGVGEADAWQVETMTDSQWSSSPLGRPDLVVLANVSAITSDRATELARLVESGTGLMIFVGDQVDPDNYNQVLFKEGTGVLPARLESVVDSEAHGVVLEDVDRSPLEALQQLNAAVLQQIHVRKIMDVQVPADVAGIHTLARWNDPASSAAAIARDFGSGRVLLWTIGADRDWTDWPTEPSYVLAMREAAKAIARTDAASRHVTAGDTIRRGLGPGQQATSPTIELPGSESPRAVQIIQEKVSLPGIDEPLITLSFGDTQHAGLYTLTWGDSQSGKQHDTFAVNPDRRESDLERIAIDELKSLFGVLEPDIIPAVSGSDQPIAVRGVEVWRSFAAILLGLLAMEACFATWAGRQR